MKKRMLLLCLFVLLLLPQKVYAETAEMPRELPMYASVGVADVRQRLVLDSGTCGDDLRWVLYDDGELSISGSGDMAHYDDECLDFAPWYVDRNEIASVTIGDGVSSIGWSAFSGCSSLTTVEISDSVTQIWGRAFSDCSSLTSIEISANVTEIGEFAFQDCIGLTAITVDPANTAYCSDADGVLFTKDMKTLIAYPAGRSAAEYTIPSGVTCIKDSAFSGCSSLTSVEIPVGVTSIEARGFSGCSSLTTIEIPAGMTSIGHDAFSGCSSLTSIKIPASVKFIGSPAFKGCKGLTAFTVDPANTVYCNNADGVLFTKDMKTLIAYPAGRDAAEYTILDGVAVIDCYAFSKVGSLTSIKIPASVTTIGEGAFSGCNSLTAIEIPASVTMIQWYAFDGCSNLTTARFMGDAPAVFDIDVFQHCSEDFEIRYDVGAAGWRMPLWNGYPTRVMGKEIDMTGTDLSRGKVCYQIINTEAESRVVLMAARDEHGKMLQIFRLEVEPYAVMVGEWNVPAGASVSLFMTDGNSVPVMEALHLNG